MEIIADPGDQWIRHFLNKSETRRNSRKVFFICFNLFFPNAPFPYPLKTSEMKCFQGVEKGCIGNVCGK